MKMKENLLMIFILLILLVLLNTCLIFPWLQACDSGRDVECVCASSAIFWCKEINIYEVTVVRSSPEYQTTNFSKKLHLSSFICKCLNVSLKWIPKIKSKSISSREDLWNLAETRNEEKCKKVKSILAMGSKC